MRTVAAKECGAYLQVQFFSSSSSLYYCTVYTSLIMLMYCMSLLSSMCVFKMCICALC